MSGYRNKFIDGLLWIVLSALSILAREAVTVHFFDTATVVISEIKLGDIAKISAESSLKKKLVNLTVAKSAPAGFSRYLNSDKSVIYTVKNRFPNLDVKVTGAARIRINTIGKTSKLFDYEQLIQDYVSSKIQWKKEYFSVEVKNGDREWKTYPTAFDITVEGQVKSFSRGTIRLKLKIKQNDLTLNIPVICVVNVVVPVVKTRELITRGSKLNKSDLFLEKEDITLLRFTPFMKIEDLNNKVASRMITAGSLVSRIYVKSTPIISKGEVVYIKLSKGAIRLSVAARSREDGMVGDKIWVENMKTHKIVRVIIRENGEVNLMEGEMI